MILSLYLSPASVLTPRYGNQTKAEKFLLLKIRRQKDSIVEDLFIRELDYL